MIDTDNKVLNSLLDALVDSSSLLPEERKLLLVGKCMVSFSPEGEKMLSEEVAQLELRLNKAKLALALSRLGNALGAKMLEVSEQA